MNRTLISLPIMGHIFDRYFDNMLDPVTHDSQLIDRHTNPSPAMLVLAMNYLAFLERSRCWVQHYYLAH